MVLEVGVVLVVQGREIGLQIEVRVQRMDPGDMGRGGGVVAEPGVGGGEEGVGSPSGAKINSVGGSPRSPRENANPKSWSKPSRVVSPAGKSGSSVRLFM